MPTSNKPVNCTIFTFMITILQLALPVLCNWTKRDLENIDKAMEFCLKPDAKRNFPSMKQRHFFCDDAGASTDVHMQHYAACLAEHLQANKPSNWEQGVKQWQALVKETRKPNCGDPAWGKDRLGRDFRMSAYDNIYSLNAPIDFDPSLNIHAIRDECLLKTKKLLVVTGHYYCKVGADGNPVPGEYNEVNLREFKDCVTKQAYSLSAYWNEEYEKLVNAAKLFCDPRPTNEQRAYVEQKRKQRLNEMILPFGCFFNGQEMVLEQPAHGSGVRARCIKRGDISGN